MKLKNRVSVFFLMFFFLNANAQTSQRIMPLEEVLQLALENHAQLKLSVANVKIANQQTKVAELQQLPTITAGASSFYVGNIKLMDENFSKVESFEMPHFGNTYGIQASEVLYKGGLVKKSIEISQLREQISELDLERDQQNIKFLVLSNYLDIQKAINQREVYLHNRKLAQQRLDNVQKMYQQGMVTRNEVIRGELMIKNLDQAILVIENNRLAHNYQLTTAIGLSPDVLIVPDENTGEIGALNNLQYYFDLAHTNHPVIKSAKTSIAMAEKNVEITKSERMPTVAAVGGYNMNRPLTNSLPAKDLYASTWQAGISISYNIDNLFKTGTKEKLSKMQAAQATNAMLLQQQNLDILVNTSFLKFQEAMKQAEISKESEKLANENYRIIEAKYLNQQALQADMLDATNAKLEAELQYANAEINVLYQYSNLLRATGTL
ncbi:TolC family protein [Pontibacter sp. E15-1]|uniref:TolC family protein n=1 Tax=Pontibacter sp. E15-1 TaxID=2919918 RepID=UPI001F5041BB|nr:TolC family protein [Pontibacter sp. E15-1]MCJ8165992.1 TolC family protein [Pontibacter sp. E15-1]